MHDVIVIGGGPCGLATALAASKLGLRVLLCEKRAPLDQAVDDTRRFQAVVIDEATLNNLVHLGVPITKEDGFHELKKARFPSSERDEELFANYHPWPAKLSGVPSGDLAEVGFRRKIVAVTSIRNIEDRLLACIKKQPLIETLFNAEVQSLTNNTTGVTVTVNGVSFSAKWLAVADGANSHEKGTLKLLGIRKTPLAPAIRVVAARYRTEGRAGELCIREALDEPQRHTAFFGLKDESVIYTDVPAGVNAQDPEVAYEYMAEIGPKLRVSEIIGTPLLVKQQTMIADRFRSKQALVLGDAAFSGTAVLGVYLNKAICDAIGFSEFLTTGRRANEAITPSVYHQFMFEESLVSFAYNYRGSQDLPSALRDFLEALPRSAFRLKTGRYGIPRSIMRNYVDLASVATRNIAELPPLQNSRLQPGFLFATRMMRAMGDVLEPAYESDTR